MACGEGVLVVEDFRGELHQFCARLSQQPAPAGGDGEVAPAFALDDFLLAAEQPGAFQVVQHGIERARSEGVAVVAQLVHDFHAADRLSGRMVEDVQPHKAGEQVSQDTIAHIGFRY